MKWDYRMMKEFGDLLNDEDSKKTCSRCGVEISLTSLNVFDKDDQEYDLLCDLCNMNKEYDF